MRPRTTKSDDKIKRYDKQKQQFVEINSSAACEIFLFSHWKKRSQAATNATDDIFRSVVDLMGDQFVTYFMCLLPCLPNNNNKKRRTT